MNTARMAILGVASLAGICCVGVLMHGLAGAKPPAPTVVVAAAPPPIPTQEVLVASRELAVGERIQGGDMSWQAWPASAVNVEYVTQGPPNTAQAQSQFGQAASKVTSLAKNAVNNPADGPGSVFVGAIVREKINKDEPLIASKVVRSGQSGVMAVTLDPGMRAVALPLTAESAAGGFILPGDHVDVILTRQVDAQGASASATHGNVASTVMRNVRVLAVDQNMGGGAAAKPGAAAAAIGATATVEATPAQAEYLVLAKASGTLTLSLRSYADAAGGAEIGSMSHDASGAGGMTVRVFRNSTPTAVTVAR